MRTVFSEYGQNNTVRGWRCIGPSGDYAKCQKGSATIVAYITYVTIAADTASVSATADHCSDIDFGDGAFAVDIRATDASCDTAHQLAESSFSGRLGVHHALGFSCVTRGSGVDADQTVCTRGRSRVTWKNEA